MGNDFNNNNYSYTKLLHFKYTNLSLRVLNKSKKFDK